MLYLNPQGDEEKALGMKPLEMMDRDFKHKLPSCQVCVKLQILIYMYFCMLCI